MIRYYFSSLPTLLFRPVSVRLPVLPATATFGRNSGIVESAPRCDARQRIPPRSLTASVPQGATNGYSSYTPDPYPLSKDSPPCLHCQKHPPSFEPIGAARANSSCCVTYVSQRTGNCSNPRCARSGTCESLGHLHHAHEGFNLAWVKPPYSVACVIIRA